MVTKPHNCRSTAQSVVLTGNVASALTQSARQSDLVLQNGDKGMQQFKAHVYVSK